MEGRALIPRRDQPVRRQGGRQRTPDDETEVPRACAGDQARFGASCQRIYDRGGVVAVLGQELAETLANRRGVDPRCDRSFVETAEEGRGVVQRGMQRCGSVNT
ncbi:hypothetical protein LOC73_06320 [Mycolicibacterium mageritense]|nr:hypothetical protein [Mycolicibacterium mageritense]